MKKYLAICALICFCSFAYAQEVTTEDASVDFVLEKSMVIVIPSYNNSEWYKQNLDSVITQSYTNYSIIYIDDCSPDGTGALVREYIQEYDVENKVTLICNEQRKGALANLYNAIHSCDDTDIIVTVDGDDWLAHGDVLKTLNEAYADPNIWMTYGQFVEYPSGAKGFCQDMPRKIVKRNAFRKYRPHPSHLRTFYAKLFKQIPVDDLLYEGEFYSMSWDLAMMLPMIEMARRRHFKFIPDILYVYNNANSINDHKVSKSLQQTLDQIISGKKPYKRLCLLFEQKPIVVVVASYNNKDWYIQNLDSIFKQNYDNYFVIYIDDNSTDGTGDLVQKYIDEKNVHNKIKLIRNQQRMGALANQYKVIHECNDNDIIIIVDGDDWLAHARVFEKINEVYNSGDIWLTYGQFQHLSTGEKGFCVNYPPKIVKTNAFRKFTHLPSHLRTFYAGLFKKIVLADLLYHGKFFSMTGDAAAMLPMIEMAADHFKFIPDILYIYNDETLLNDHKISCMLQKKLDLVIRGRKPYKKLTKLLDE